VVRGKRADRHERRGAERKLSRVTGEQIEAERGERKNQERNRDRGEPVLIRGERNDDERDGESSDHRDSVLPNRKDLLVLGVCRLELPGFAVKHMAPVIPRFYGSCQAPSESCGIESSAMAIDRECDAYKFAGKNNGSLDGGQSACPIAFVQRTPQFRFAGGTSSVKQQPPQLSRPALRQTAPSDALPGVFRSGIEADKRHRGIAIAQRHALKSIGQGDAEQWTDAQDAFHTSQRFGL